MVPLPAITAWSANGWTNSRPGKAGWEWSAITATTHRKEP